MFEREKRAIEKASETRKNREMSNRKTENSIPMIFELKIILAAGYLPMRLPCK